MSQSSQREQCPTCGRPSGYLMQSHGHQGKALRIGNPFRWIHRRMLVAAFREELHRLPTAKKVSTRD